MRLLALCGILVILTSCMQALPSSPVRTSDSGEEAIITRAFRGDMSEFEYYELYWREFQVDRVVFENYRGYTAHTPVTVWFYDYKNNKIIDVFEMYGYFIAQAVFELPIYVECYPNGFYCHQYANDGQDDAIAIALEVPYVLNEDLLTQISEEDLAIIRSNLDSEWIEFFILLDYDSMQSYEK